ncbi:hypothetical protein CPB97_008171 [Podila verticillata]|nr:hypothetical protein CPB97_008171 [Podila verticillata]
MTGATSPIIRARNAKYQSSKRPGPRRSTSSSSLSSHSNKVAKPLLNPYVVGFFLVILSGGAFFQVLKLFGLGADEHLF